MKSFPNVLRIVLDDPPTSFADYDSIEPMFEAKDGPVRGEQQADGSIHFHTNYICKEKFQGPAFKKEKDGRVFVYIGWYGKKGGMVTRFRRLKVHLHHIPNIVWDSEIIVAGKAKDGSPACATATVISARNIEDFIPKPEELAPPQAPPK